MLVWSSLTLDNLILISTNICCGFFSLLPLKTNAPTFILQLMLFLYWGPKNFRKPWNTFNNGNALSYHQIKKTRKEKKVKKEKEKKERRRRRTWLWIYFFLLMKITISSPPLWITLSLGICWSTAWGVAIVTLQQNNKKSEIKHQLHLPLL